MLTPGGSMGGRYRLEERIATGGMGDVWKCEDTVLGREVALKVLQPAMLEEPGFAERFRAEARVMATINHPGVVSVYDYGESSLEGGGSVAYLVMEYVEGEPLHRVLANVGRLAPARVMDLIAQAADALQAAHDRGIVHRDVKPGNLLVRPNGELVLTDFGIARSALTGNLTAVGAVLGTASYVSPEQASGTGNITPASDIYSLGVVAYQCLAGHRPFEGENPIEVAMKHVRDEPPPLPADVPENVRSVVIRAMSKDVAARWPDARTMGEAARTAGAGGVVIDGAEATMMHPAAGGMPPGGPGGFRPGAASVPPAGAGHDEETYYQPAGYHEGQGGGYHEDYRRQPRKGRGGLVFGLVAIALALVLGIGLIAWLADGNGKPDASPSKDVAKTFSLNEEEYLGRPVNDVVDELEAKDLDVTKEKKPRTGYEVNTVTALDPPGDTKVKKGDDVIVYYQPPQNNDGGIGNPLPGAGNGDDDDGDNGGDEPTNTPTQPSQPPTSESPQSPPPSSSPADPGFGGGSDGLAAPKED